MAKTSYKFNLWSLLTVGDLCLSSLDLSQAVQENRISYIVKGDGTKLDQYYTNAAGLRYFRAVSDRAGQDGVGFIVAATKPIEQSEVPQDILDGSNNIVSLVEEFAKRI